jgi:transcriptional regulator with XRE-family HTH domain
VKNLLGNTSLHCGNTLPPMRKGNNEALEALADTLSKIMETRQLGGARIKELRGPAVRTINNIINRRHRPTFATLDKLAKALGMKPYQLLVPVNDTGFLTLLRAYNEADDAGREILLMNAEILLGRVANASREKPSHGKA